jgi:hypothetical protein
MKRRPRKRRGWPVGSPVSLNTLQKKLSQIPRTPAFESRGPRFVQPTEPAYCAVFLAGWRSASGFRTCGFTTVSSTGVVPLTSELNVAPAGTR